MTDNTNSVAGNYPGGIRQTCILDEGAPTVSTGMNEKGTYQTFTTWATPLEVGDVVAINDDTACTWAACGGIPCVNKPENGETLVIGQIVYLGPEALQAQPPNTAAGDSLAKRLTGKYYRVAEVEIWGGITKITKGVLMHDGTRTVVPGTVSNIQFNITSGYSATGQGLQFDIVNGSGVGAIPFHYVAAGTDGDLSNCLLGITGLMVAVTGA